MPSSADSGRYVKRIWWHNNAEQPAIRIRYADGELEDKLLYLTADFGSGVISWQCKAPSSGGVPVADRPANFRE